MIEGSCHQMFLIGKNWQVRPQTQSLFFGSTVEIAIQPICVVEITFKFYLWDRPPRVTPFLLSNCHLSSPFLLSSGPYHLSSPFLLSRNSLLPRTTSLRFPQYFLSEQPWSKEKPKAISLLNFLEDGLKYTDVFQVSVVHNIRHFDLLSRTQLCNVVELIRVVQYVWKRDISGVLSFDKMDRPSMNVAYKILATFLFIL